MEYQRQLEEVQVFYGRATTAEARVYARLRGDFKEGEFSLGGAVVGPRCEYAKTLEAKVPLVDQGPGESLLAAAVVPDPCFWTAELPFVYDVQVELQHNGRGVAGVSRPVGIRPLGVAGQRFAKAGRNWVLRGARRGAVSSEDLAAWHDAGAAMYAASPEEALCEEASRKGVLLVAEVTGPAAQVQSELTRLARWPGVGLAVVVPEEELPAEVRDAAPNILLGQRTGAGTAAQLAPWAQFAVLEMAAPGLPEGAELPEAPLVLLRPGDGIDGPAAARAECDRLQADTAGQGEFCGYIV